MAVSCSRLRWSAGGNFAAASRCASTSSSYEVQNLLDREVGAEHGPFGAEDRDGLARDGFDVCRIVAVDEGSKRRRLGDHIRLRGEQLHAGAPFS